MPLTLTGWCSVDDVLSMVMSMDGIPTLSETDVILAELRRLPQTTETAALIDDLLEFRTLLAARSTDQTH